MVRRAELTQTQEQQKSPDAYGAKAQGHGITSDARGPESSQSTQPDRHHIIRLSHDKALGPSVT